MQGSVQYIPFHKNCKNMTVIGELEITPEGIGCKTNEYLSVEYYACESKSELENIQKNGFQLKDTPMGKCVCMYSKYEDAIGVNDKYIVFSRVTKGNFKTIESNEKESFNHNGLDRVEVNENGKVTDYIYNLANIDTIALLEFED